jgi:hypothetical protein
MSRLNRLPRNWLVLSVIWLAVLGALTYRYFPDDLVGGAFQPQSLGIAEFGRPHPWHFPRVDRRTAEKWDADGSKHRMVMLDRSVLYVDGDSNDERRRFLAHTFWMQRLPRIAFAAFIVLGLALLPYVGFLAMKYAAPWIRRRVVRD